MRLLNASLDKRLFETKRKDQLNALKNLVELNDINQQYKIIDIMLKGLFKVCVCVIFFVENALFTHTNLENRCIQQIKSCFFIVTPEPVFIAMGEHVLHCNSVAL